MFRVRVPGVLRLAFAAYITPAAILPPGAFLCVDGDGHPRFEVAALNELSPIDHPGHRDEGLPDCPGDHSRPCHDYRLGGIHVFSSAAAVSVTAPHLSSAPLLLIDDSFAGAFDVLVPRIAVDVGRQPDSQPRRITLRI